MKWGDQKWEEKVTLIMVFFGKDKKRQHQKSSHPATLSLEKFIYLLIPQFRMRPWQPWIAQRHRYLVRAPIVIQLPELC